VRHPALRHRSHLPGPCASLSIRIAPELQPDPLQSQPRPSPRRAGAMFPLPHLDRDWAHPRHILPRRAFPAGISHARR
jgi:hypothetical protein